MSVSPSIIPFHLAFHLTTDPFTALADPIPSHDSSRATDARGQVTERWETLGLGGREWGSYLAWRTGLLGLGEEGGLCVVAG
jgi:hypothetical protein